MVWQFIDPLDLFEEPIQRMQQFQRDLNQFFDKAATTTGRTYPAVDVWSGENEVLVRVTAPGAKREDLDVTVEHATLTVKGKRSAEESEKATHVHLRERVGGSFERAVRLPYPVDAEKVSADYRLGVLTIRLPRAEQAKPRSIKVG